MKGTRTCGGCSMLEPSEPDLRDRRPGPCARREGTRRRRPSNEGKTLSGDGAMRIFLTLTCLLLLAVSPAAGKAFEPRVVRFAGQVRIIQPVAGGLLVAGPGPQDRAWFALLDPALEERVFHRFDDCGRCSLMAAAPLGKDRILLAGARDARGDSVEDGWVVLVDGRSGEVLRQRIVRPPSGGRFLAAASGFGRLLVAGEMLTDAGAGLDAWMVELDPGNLEPRDEWRFGGPLPDAAAAVLPVAADAFIAAGWRFSAETGMLGGWVARFGAASRPVWKTLLDGEAGFDVAAILPAADRSLTLLGQDSRPDRTTRSLLFDLRGAVVDPDDGRVDRRFALPDPAIDHMGTALLGTADGTLALASRQPHPHGSDALELFSLEPREGFRSLFVWRDGERATVPAALASDGHGLLVGGWYRTEEQDPGPRGWLARFR